MDTNVSRTKRTPEWLEFGDPRCAEGHFRPKRNLDTWLRQTDGWSQKKLAEVMGTDEGSVSKWISGKKYLTDKALAKVARFTGLSVAYLLDLQHCGDPAEDDYELDALDYTELSDEDIAFLEEHEYVPEDKPLGAWGIDYGPHETRGFAEDLAGESESLWSERWRSERRGLPSRDEDPAAFAKALETEWNYDEHPVIYEYLHMVGDIRDPWHLEKALHDDIMSLRPAKRALLLDNLAEVMLGFAGAMTVAELKRTHESRCD